MNTTSRRRRVDGYSLACTVTLGLTITLALIAAQPAAPAAAPPSALSRPPSAPSEDARPLPAAPAEAAPSGRTVLLDVDAWGSVGAALVGANDQREFDDAPETLHLVVRASRRECALQLAERLLDDGFERVTVIE
jgi:hypothetical protein